MVVRRIVLLASGARCAVLRGGDGACDDPHTPVGGWPWGTRGAGPQALGGRAGDTEAARSAPEGWGDSWPALDPDPAEYAASWTRSDAVLRMLHSGPSTAL